MRKIISMQEEGIRKKRNQMTLAFFMLFIMFVSVIAYGFESVLFSGISDTSGNIESVNYNGFEFFHQGSFWTLNRDGKDFIFRYNPNEVGQINPPLNGIDSYRNKTLYIYSGDFNQESEIRTNMAGFVNKLQNACPEDEQCDSDIPVKTCEDNFIVIREGVEGIRQEKGCVFIEGKKEDLTRLTDAFLFRVLGINS